MLITCGLEIGLLIAGVVLLVVGKCRVSKNRVVTGTAARIAGMMLVLPLPLAFTTGLVIGLLSSSLGKPVDRVKLQPKIAIAELCIVVACALLGISIALVAARPTEDGKPIRRRVRKDRFDEDMLPEPASAED